MKRLKSEVADKEFSGTRTLKVEKKSTRVCGVSKRLTYRGFRELLVVNRLTCVRKKDEANRKRWEELSC